MEIVSTYSVAEVHHESIQEIHSPFDTLWNSCYHSINEENCSGVPKSEFKLLADKMYHKTLTVKDPQKAFPFCLHHNVPILWESPEFDAMTCQLTNNELVNKTRATMGSGMEHPIGS